MYDVGLAVSRGGDALDAVGRRRDDGKRSEQFVGDVGEHHSHLKAVLGAETLTIPDDGESDAHNEQHYIYKVCPPRCVPRWEDLDLDGVWQFVPVPIAVGSFHM